ncbi:DUF2752 domain-containing protein [Portibacter marinus]|uniref:DUF2752 domain-containing protein n=1 Tax=Portibacter marinus TaxID=2898660 RepID=UPI001F199CA1|nr:DUF2752 domain-containing protein [Portibacter marinus]
MRKIFKAFYSYRGQQIWLLLLIIFPILLWILPSSFFDGDGLVLCPSRLFFSIECFGCGITRSVMHMHHFEFDDAVYYNVLGLVIYPALIVLWCYWVYKAYLRLKKSQTIAA